MDLTGTQTDADDVATVCLSNGLSIRASLLKKIPGTDVIRRGILALDRMRKPHAKWQHALVVMPGLEIERPTFMTRSVTICRLEFEMVRAALLAQVATGS